MYHSILISEVRRKRETKIECNNAVNCIFLTDLPGHNITISTSGIQSAGSSVILHCTISLQNSLLSVPTVHWFDNNGVEISNSSTVIVTMTQVSSLLTTLSLNIQELRTSQAGSYTCQAVSDLPSLGLVKKTSSRHTLKVASK